ncbi:MAG: enoyl-CoA hydratase/isomerase family protein [Rhodospirillaceae bacterium]|jgi:enoyl-CoA hydratase|nr:enoyl-CoA hydratase/isomerase family protein [Rhodospirillaceae bacterium]MBT5666567.1 enoyl-CoA hydratase/isomerase family protein [Rhodospirillaceae bacterium]MBT5808975.1 enoyl-CoA hydratase/isomerase family protein [Rhodospirillaceae bacterium]
MDYSSYKHMKISRRDRILTIMLNRPPMNPIHYELHNELSRIWYQVQVDQETDVVIFTGAGEVFSAGGDIPMMQRRIDDPELFNQKNLEMKQMIFGLLDLEKPIIARINGDCIGLGATLALLCDIVIAVDDARFGDPHVKMGYVAGDGGAVIWPQLIGFGRAKEYLLTGDMLDAREAERIGLINHAVPREALDDKVTALAEKLANGATKAIKWTKASINIPLRQLAHSIMDASLAYEALTNIGPDHQEAVAAFQEKRKPKFTGR